MLTLNHSIVVLADVTLFYGYINLLAVVNNMFPRTCNTQKQLNHELQQESLELQQQAIINAPHLEDKIKEDPDQKMNRGKS